MADRSWSQFAADALREGLLNPAADLTGMAYGGLTGLGELAGGGSFDEALLRASKTTTRNQNRLAQALRGVAADPLGAATEAVAGPTADLAGLAYGGLRGLGTAAMGGTGPEVAESVETGRQGISGAIRGGMAGLGALAEGRGLDEANARVQALRAGGSTPGGAAFNETLGTLTEPFIAPPVMAGKAGLERLEASGLPGAGLAAASLATAGEALGTLGLPELKGKFRVPPSARTLATEEAVVAVKEALAKTKKAGKRTAAEYAERIAAGEPPEVIAQVRKGLLDKAKGEMDAALAAANPVDATYIPWEHVTQEEAASLAAKGEHLRQDPKTGQYVGAPRGFKSKRQILAQRRAAAEWVMQGLEGVNWYPRERAWTAASAPGGAVKYLADLIGINSPQAQPGPNLQWGLGSMWQNAMDASKAALKNPPKRIQQAAQGIVAKIAPMLPIGGEKVGAFAARLFEKPKGGMSVNDLWNARLLGYGPNWDKGLGPAMHNYSAGETNAVRNLILNDPKYRARIDALGINPADLDVNAIQAAGWVKGRIDNIVKRKKLKALPDDPVRRKAIIDEAAAGFSTYAPRHEMKVQGARVPVGGKDPLYDALGIAQTPSEAGEARPLVAYEKKKHGLGKLSPAARRGTRTVEAVRSYVTGEEPAAVAEQYKSTTAKGKVNTVPIEVERKLKRWDKLPQGTGEQSARLAEVLRKEPKASEALEGGLQAWLEREAGNGPARPDVARAREFLLREGLAGLKKLSKSEAAKLGLPALAVGLSDQFTQREE